MKKILFTGLLAGVVMIIVSLLLNLVFSLIFPSFQATYQNTSIFRAADDPLMFAFWFYPLVLGITLSWIYVKTKKLYKAKTVFSKSLKFTWAYFVIAGIPAFIINVTSFVLPISMVLSWSIMTFVTVLIAGMIFVKLHK